MPTIQVPFTKEDGRGNVIESGFTTVEITQGEANHRSLMDKARAALVVNKAYIDLASPTAPQTVVQVTRLSRQMNLLIRELIQALDDISDT